MDIATLALICLAAVAGGYVWFKFGRFWVLILLLLVGTAGIGCFILVHSFQTLSTKTQVGTVHCSNISNIPHTMVVELDGKSYEMMGDRWELNGSVIRVQPWMHFLGVKSGYTLDRLTSQFDGTGAHEVKPVELGGFSLYKMINLWRYFPIIESAHGNGVILPCDGRTYTVSIDINGQMYAQA